MPEQFSDKEPKTSYICYTPLDPRHEEWLQFSTLQVMGYPVDIEFINNTYSDLLQYQQRCFDDTWLPWKIATCARWAKVTIPGRMVSFMEWLDGPGSALISGIPETDNLLRKHPVSILWKIDWGDVETMTEEYELYQAGDTSFDLRHQRDDFPWDDFLKRCIVTAGARHIELQEKGIPPEHLSDPSPEALVLYDQLKNEVSPLNGEQLAGIVSDYYHLAEAAVPEFAALRQHVTS